MKLQNNKLIAEYEIDRDKYWLLCEKGKIDVSPNFDCGIWRLAAKIDRSYKGKSPDIAVPSVLIDDKKVFNQLKKKLDVVWEN